VSNQSSGAPILVVWSLLDEDTADKVIGRLFDVIDETGISKKSSPAADSKYESRPRGRLSYFLFFVGLRLQVLLQLLVELGDIGVRP
jgi:hypothetical protein